MLDVALCISPQSTAHCVVLMIGLCVFWVINLDVMFSSCAYQTAGMYQHPRAVIDATEAILTAETLAPAARRSHHGTREEKGEGRLNRGREGLGQGSGHRGVFGGMESLTGDEAWVERRLHLAYNSDGTSTDLSFAETLSRSIHFHPIIPTPLTPFSLLP